MVEPEDLLQVCVKEEPGACLLLEEDILPDQEDNYDESSDFNLDQNDSSQAPLPYDIHSMDQNEAYYSPPPRSRPTKRKPDKDKLNMLQTETLSQVRWNPKCSICPTRSTQTRAIYDFGSTDGELFRFPKNARIRSEWVKFANVPPTDERRLCYRHFEEYCFLPAQTEYEGKRLIPNAVPTLHGVSFIF